MNIVEKWALGVIFLLIVAILALTMLPKPEWKVREERLFAECLADGMKEYECEGLLRRGRR